MQDTVKNSRGRIRGLPGSIGQRWVLFGVRQVKVQEFASKSINLERSRSCPPVSHRRTISVNHRSRFPLLLRSNLSSTFLYALHAIFLYPLNRPFPLYSSFYSRTVARPSCRAASDFTPTLHALTVSLTFLKTSMGTRRG